MSLLLSASTSPNSKPRVASVEDITLRFDGLIGFVLERFENGPVFDLTRPDLF